MSFGFVVDDHGPDKVKAGGALAFAAQLSEHAIDEAAHAGGCPSCQLLARPMACIGIIATPISAVGEKWLVERLPEEIESVGGFLLRKAILDFGYDGARARVLRQAGRLAAKEPFERHYGPFFRRFVVGSEQILEELLCAGDIAPAHALGILMHLGALEVDGRVPSKMEDGDQLGVLIEHPETRKSRTRVAVVQDDGDASVAGLASLLCALYAGFVLNVDVFVLDSEEPR